MPKYLIISWIVTSYVSYPYMHMHDMSVDNMNLQMNICLFFPSSIVPGWNHLNLKVSLKEIHCVSQGCKFCLPCKISSLVAIQVMGSTHAWKRPLGRVKWKYNYEINKYETLNYLFHYSLSLTHTHMHTCTSHIYSAAQNHTTILYMVSERFGSSI